MVHRKNCKCGGEEVFVFSDQYFQSNIPNFSNFRSVDQFGDGDRFENVVLLKSTDLKKRSSPPL